MNIQKIIADGCVKAGHAILPALIRVEWNGRFTRRLGDATYNHATKNGRIRLSTQLWASMNEYEKTDTVLHEVAHIINMYRGTHDKTRGGHNNAWKQICRTIGAKPQQYAPASTADFAQFRRRATRHAVSCGCNKPHMITSHRLTKMKKGHRYGCRLCQQPLRIIT